MCINYKGKGNNLTVKELVRHQLNQVMKVKMSGAIRHIDIIDPLIGCTEKRYESIFVVFLPKMHGLNLIMEK